MIEGIQNIFRIPELRQRILFTIGMLGVYRAGCHIATPGINPEAIKAFFDQMSGTALELFNLFSGGALEQLSIFALGIMPYISASIIIQLLTVVIPQLEALQKEGEEGRRKITQWTRYGTIGLALFQSFLIAKALENGQFGANAVINPGWRFELMAMITLTTGTAFIMWLGEQITERGIGNGISLVIFSSIVIGVPGGIGQMIARVNQGENTLLEVLALLGIHGHRDGGCRLLRACPATDSNPTCASCGWPKSPAGRHELLSAARKHGRRAASDFRLKYLDVPSDDCAVQ